jgi:hypothetical protein
VRQTVRHEHPVEAHALPPRIGCAHPLSCGEADDSGEADWHHHPRIRSVSVVRVGAACLPHPALRGSLRVGGRGGVRGEGVGGWCAECRSGVSGGAGGAWRCFPGVMLVLVSGGRCAGKVVGKLPRSARWFPAGVVTVPVALRGR